MKNEVAVKLGERISQIRNGFGISQEELAFRCNVHRAYMGFVERGEKNLTLKSIEKIAKGLNVPIKELFSFEKMYNQNYYIDGELWQLKPKEKAIHTYHVSDGTVVAMFQGQRGSHPELDFKIKILREGQEERPEPPTHVYWVVDLIIRSQKYPDEIKEIFDYFIKFYDKVNPF